MNRDCPEEFMSIANLLADASGAAIRPYFRSGVTIEDKPDESPVTAADKRAEQEIRRRLQKHCPDHGIVGEEFGAQDAGRSHVWVIDPIDGTRSFIHGVPTFTTLIALLRDGEPILGVVDQPVSGERWLGARGYGTTLNSARVTTRDAVALDRAAMYTTTPDMYEEIDAPAYDRLRSVVHATRFGLDGYAGGLLASGLIDLHVEGAMQPWDYMALVPVIENAGGIMTDWQGRGLTLDTGRGLTIGASCLELHEAALSVLNR